MVPSSVDQLEQVARQAASVRTVGRLGQGDGAIELELIWRDGHWFGLTYERRGLARIRRSGDRGDSFARVLCTLAGRSPAAGPLDAGSISCTSTGSPVKGKALRDLCAHAFCEALHVAPPSAEQTAAAQASARGAQQATRAQRKELLALLASGGDGHTQWHARRAEAKRLAPFRKADLAGRDLSGVRLVSMPEASFAGARLEGADLSGADFTRASFRGASLGNAKLVHANLKKADLGGADLRGANLTRAQLQGASLADADLAGAVLERAQFDGETTWPNGFALPADLWWVGEGPDPAALAAIAARKKTEGPVDMAAFMARLQKTIEGPRLAKALGMLKKERFQLFAEVGPTQLGGVVKSQSDQDLVYACTLGADGRFGCATQNLNVCGGLRGALCKHLLVLSIGLARAGQIDADTLDEWVQRSALVKPATDKEATSAIFLRYKGAAAGEIDWRPTETLPEDFYAY